MNDRGKSLLQVIGLAASVTLGLIIVDLYEGEPIGTMIIGNSFAFVIAFIVGIFFKRKEIFSN